MLSLDNLTIEDLTGLKARIEAEIASRGTNAMRVTLDFGAYNDRRYSRPWIAKVTSWPVGGRPELEFGSYIGNAKGGEVEIMARPGQIVRAGQKDTRGNNTDNDWYVVTDAGKLEKISQSQARELFK